MIKNPTLFFISFFIQSILIIISQFIITCHISSNQSNLYFNKAVRTLAQGVNPIPMIWWWYEMNDKMEILISILFRFHHLLIKFIKIDIMSKSIFTSLGLLKTMKELLSPLFLVFIFIIWIGLFWDRKRNGCCRLWEREMVEITLSFYLSSSYLIFDQLYPISSYHHNTPYRIIQKIWGWNLWTILLIWWPLPTHASVKFIYRDGRWYGEWYEIVDGEWDGKYFKYFIVRWWMRYGRWWMRFGEWDGKYFMMIDDWW